MTHQVLWSDEALTRAQAYASDDRRGLLAVFDRVDGLAVDPRPVEAFSWGDRLFRLRIGIYRVVFQIREEAEVIEIIHLGRSA